MPFLLLINFSGLCYDQPFAVSYKNITYNSSIIVLIQCLILEGPVCYLKQK